MKRMKRLILPILILIILATYVSVVNAADTAGPPPPTPTPGTAPGSTTSTADTSKSSISSGLVDSKVLSVSLSNIDPNPAVTGEGIEIRIAIENMGSTTANNIIMEIVPEYPFELLPNEEAVKDVGIIEGYKVDSTANIKVVKYRAKINKDAPAGNYELKVKYYEKGSNDKLLKSLYIDVRSRTNLEVIHIDKAALVPGKISSLKFTVNNVGNAPLRDITFNWENKDSVILPVGSDNTKYIKYIDVNEGYNLEYQVIADTNANPGLYKLNIYLTYRDNVNGTMKQLSTIAGVYIGGETNFDIALSDSANGETSFSIANIGRNPAYAVLVTIPEQTAWKVISSNAVIIGNLNAGDYTVASFKLRPDNNSSGGSSQNSSSKISMQIDYTDTMGERKVIGKEVKLGKLNISTDEEKTKQGQQGDLSQLVIIIIIVIALVLAYQKYKTKKMHHIKGNDETGLANETRLTNETGLTK